MKLSCKGNEYK